MHIKLSNNFPYVYPHNGPGDAEMHTRETHNRAEQNSIGENHKVNGVTNTNGET